MKVVGKIFLALDGAVNAVKRIGPTIRAGLGSDPVTSLIAGIIIFITGVVVVLSDTARLVDKIAGWIERGVVTIAFTVMTFLAFNEYLQREIGGALETDLGGIWALQGQMNLAMLLMVVVGFVGASLATQEKKHIAVDAIDRVLTPGPARWVKRFTAAVASGLAYLFMKGSLSAMMSSSHDAFEGVKVAGWMVKPINALTHWLPGEKYGPSTPFKSMMAWEDAKFDAGLDFDQLPTAFYYVEQGSKLPLWIPLLVLTISFGLIAARFAARALSPKLENINLRGGTKSSADMFLAAVLPAALLTMAAGVWLGIGSMILLASISLILLGAPLFVGIGVGTLACWVLLRNGSTETIVTDMFEAAKKQELLAIPFFVLAGNLMTRGSIAKRLIRLAKAALGGVPGGLGIGAILACAFFAAISGSSPVTVIAIGSIVYPMLIQEGYKRDYSVGVLSSAGSLGIIIPPSIPMIVYAVIVGGLPAVIQSNGGKAIDPAVLFKAGLIPGALIALVLIGYTLYLNWPRPNDDKEQIREPIERGQWSKDLFHATLGGALSLMLPVIVLGGIYGWLTLKPLGIDFTISFTVTEAAAVSVVYALFVELFVHRELKLKDLPSVFSESAIMMGSLFLILVIAISLNRFFVFEQLPEAATAWMMEHVDSTFTFLIMVNIFLLALGCVMDILSAILIVAPLLAPIAASYGINPIHFGIMFIVNLELGYLTPPMGINLFVASTVFERPILEVIRSVVPFLLLMLLCLAVIVWFPSLSLILVQ